MRRILKILQIAWLVISICIIAYLGYQVNQTRQSAKKNKITSIKLQHSLNEYEKEERIREITEKKLSIETGMQMSDKFTRNIYYGNVEQAMKNVGDQFFRHYATDSTFNNLLNCFELQYYRPNLVTPTIVLKNYTHNYYIYREIMDTSLVVINAYNKEILKPAIWREYFSDKATEPYIIRKNMSTYTENDGYIFALYTANEDWVTDLVIFRKNNNAIIPIQIYPQVKKNGLYSKAGIELLKDNTIKIGFLTEDMEDIWGGYVYFSFEKEQLLLLKTESIGGFYNCWGIEGNDEYVKYTFATNFYDGYDDIVNSANDIVIKLCDQTFLRGTLKADSVQTFSIDFENNVIEPIGVIKPLEKEVQIKRVYQSQEQLKILSDGQEFFVAAKDVEYSLK